MLLLKRPLNDPRRASAELAQDAIGDHEDCALAFRLATPAIPLEDAADRYDSAYRILVSAPPDDIAASGGAAHVVERHSCAHGARRFGHIVMRYRGRIVSLLLNASDRAIPSSDIDLATPHQIGRAAKGLSVVAVNGRRHAILLVGDLDITELTQLSRAVSMPLARRLEMDLSVDHPARRGLSGPVNGTYVDASAVSTGSRSSECLNSSRSTGLTKCAANPADCDRVRSAS